MEKLDIHHKHYRTFKHEKPRDVLVVCKRCHEIQDKIREEEGIKRSNDAYDDARFNGWLAKKYGDCPDLDPLDLEIEYEKFQDYLERNDDY